MGLSLLGALIALILALLGQSPGLLKRTGLVGARLDQNVRAFTSYAFALLVLAIGFFVAGVPLYSQTENSAVSNNSNTEGQLPESTIATEISPNEPGLSPTPIFTATAATPVTGAFGGPPSDGLDGSSNETSQSTSTSAVNSEPITSTTTSPGSATAQSPSSTPSVAAPTSTPSPTRRPSPTISPTPILSETAQIDTAGSTIWLLRTPGGRNLITISDGEIVIILPRHANQGGILWREVSTGFGIVGWVREEFLSYSE